MKTYDESELNLRLKSSVNSLSENRLESILNMPTEKACGDEWYLKKPKKKNRAIIALLPAVACLVLIAGLLTVFQLRTADTKNPTTEAPNNAAVDSTVYIDINPSVELGVDSYEKVVSVKADNKDGETVLDGMKLDGLDIDTASNAVLGSALKHGFLGKDKDVILLSVKNTDSKKAEALKTRLSSELNESLKKELGTATVLEQAVGGDDELISLAHKYSITVGKAYLVQQIIKHHPNLSFKKLAKLSLRDMVNYLKQKNVSISEIVSFTGDDPDDVIEDINEKYYGDDYDEDEDDDDEDEDEDDDDDEDEDDDDDDNNDND